MCSPSKAMTSCGKVQGQVTGGVASFKGIPYAAPPVGALRFQPPAPASPWTGVRDALDYGPSCPQPSARPQGWSQEPSLSEDCLYLNVWTPGADDGAKRPVMLWLHGGGYSIGSGSWPVYDGSALARRGDVVVVTVNHRLGILGFLDLREQGGAEFGASGNAGMLDLVAALKWVRDNVAAFGGDSSNVTIFGESGGGAKVSTLLAMPGARGLFHRAIVQSGPGLRVRVPNQAAELTSSVISDLGIAAGDVRALQALAVEKLSEAHAKLGRAATFAFSPVLHKVDLPEHPGRAMKNGTAADIPMIIGTNRDEATLFLARNGAQGAGSLDEDGLRKKLAMLGDAAPATIDAYRATRPGASPYDVLVAIESDRMMRVPSIELAERKLAGGKAPVYMYLFRWASGPLGSAHGFEIAFAFDNARPPVMAASEGRQALADRMSEAWLAFARSGNPDHAGIPTWPAYSTAERATMIFDRGLASVEHDPCGDDRKAWDSAKAPTGMPV